MGPATEGGAHHRRRRNVMLPADCHNDDDDDVADGTYYGLGRWPSLTLVVSGIAIFGGWCRHMI